MNQEPRKEHNSEQDKASQDEPVELEPIEIDEEPASTNAPSSRKAAIDKPSLLEGFDDDTDFDDDPETEHTVGGIPVDEQASKADAADASSGIWGAAGALRGKPISPSSTWKLATTIGAIATIAASVFAGVNHQSVVWAHVLLTLYLGLLHTATGLGAVLLTALVLGRSVGRFDSAASRIFASVGLFLVVFNLNLPIPGHVEETLLASVAYLGAVMVGFRLSIREAAVIGCMHFGLWMLVWAGNALSSIIGASSVVS